MVEPKQREFYVNQLTLKAQEWGEEGNPPVIALHGWLDNSASFQFLAPELNEFNLMALDLAGHGFSDHRRGVIQPYNIWEDVAEVIAVADALGWTEFSILGHSRGAIIAMLIAATFPERVTRLVEIDGLCPMPEPVEDSPKQLRKSIEESFRQQRLTRYQSLQQMVKARTSGMLALPVPAAEAIVYRGSEQVEDGFQWSSDPVLKKASSVKLTMDHIRAFISQITCPVYLAIAEGGMMAKRKEVQSILSEFPRINTQTFNGHHHLHMEPTPMLTGWVKASLGCDE